MLIFREKLKDKIESFIYIKLEKSRYKINEIDANQLLTWNRFDLALKLCYLDNVKSHSSLANEIYMHDIQAQTLGRFIELGNEENKNDFKSYIEHFHKTYQSIKKNGFKEGETLIPLSVDGSLINGAHRTASAIHLNKKVSMIITEQPTMVADYQYFFKRNVPLEYLDAAVQKFIQYSDDNIYIAFLWPSGKGSKNAVEDIFSNIVYKKTINLNVTGAFNLLLELYKHMDWVGTKDNGYKGIKQKLIECFPEFEPFKVIFFQSDSLNKVQEVKKSVRSIYGIGYSSIHITDTKEEAIRISSLLCNENGLHFLNYSTTHKASSLNQSLERFKQFLRKNEIDTENVVIDGGLILTLYGYRENSDIDFLVGDNSQIVYQDEDFESHDKELLHHGKSKIELIYDNKNNFTYNGLKFISLPQLYKMKKQRNEEKDQHDCAVMKAHIHGNIYTKFITNLRQKLFYQKIKFRHYLKFTVFEILYLTRLYQPIRFIYRMLKEKK